MHQSPLHRPRRLARRDTRRRAATAATASVGAVLLAGGITAATLAITSAAQATAGKAALPVNWYESAPYYSTLDSSGPDLGQVMSATGQKAFDMAFILASGGSCAPSWDGTDPVSSDTQVAGNGELPGQRRGRCAGRCKPTTGVGPSPWPGPGQDISLNVALYWR